VSQKNMARAAFSAVTCRALEAARVVSYEGDRGSGTLHAQAVYLV
jgi:hypothetical protein